MAMISFENEICKKEYYLPFDNLCIQINVIDRLQSNFKGLEMGFFTLRVFLVGIIPIFGRLIF